MRGFGSLTSISMNRKFSRMSTTVATWHRATPFDPKAWSSKTCSVVPTSAMHACGKPGTAATSRCLVIERPDGWLGVFAFARSMNTQRRQFDRQFDSRVRLATWHAMPCQYLPPEAQWHSTMPHGTTERLDATFGYRVYTHSSIHPIIHSSIHPSIHPPTHPPIHPPHSNPIPSHPSFTNSFIISFHVMSIEFPFPSYSIPFYSIHPASLSFFHVISFHLTSFHFIPLIHFIRSTSFHVISCPVNSFHSIPLHSIIHSLIRSCIQSFCRSIRSIHPIHTYIHTYIYIHIQRARAGAWGSAANDLMPNPNS